MVSREPCTASEPLSPTGRSKQHTRRYRHNRRACSQRVCSCPVSSRQCGRKSPSWPVSITGMRQKGPLSPNRCPVLVAKLRRATSGGAMQLEKGNHGTVHAGHCDEGVGDSPKKRVLAADGIVRPDELITHSETGASTVSIWALGVRKRPTASRFLTCARVQLACKCKAG